MKKIVLLMAAVLALTGVVRAANSVKPSITAPLFEKQKKIKGTVHAKGDAKLALVDDGVAHEVLIVKVTDGDVGGAVTFDLSTMDEEALSLKCWSGATLAGLQGTKLSDEHLKPLGLVADVQAKLERGSYDNELVEALRTAKRSAAVLKLLKPPAAASIALRKSCYWPLVYADVAKGGLRKAMTLRLTDAENQTDEQVVAQASSVKVFLHLPKEGDQVVKGEVVGEADQVRVEVYDTRGAVVDFDTASVDAASTANPAKSFTAGMNRRLAAGQTVRVIAYKGDAEINATDYTLVETVGFDWGRVRAYFSAGATVATGEVESTRNIPAGDGQPARTIPEVAWKLHSADYFVGLNLDYNWYSSLHNRTAFPCPMPAKDFEQLTDLENWIDQVQGRARRRELSDAQLQNYLERFRTVLVNTVDALESALNGSEAKCSEVELGRLSALRAFADTATNKITTFRSMRSVSDKGRSPRENAEDLYEYINDIEEALQDYRRNHYETVPGGWLVNTSFEARLGQAPVSTSETPAPNVSSIVQSANAGYLEMAVYAPVWFRQTAWKHAGRENSLFIAPIGKFSILAAQDGPVPAADRDTLFRHVYPAYHGGVRLGHFLLDARRKSVAPELVSFLDVTFGRFDNFRLPIEGSRDHIPKRVDFHGRFKIPSTPLTVGFSSNIGPGRDDTRFFVGTRFDIGRLLARLAPVVNE